MFGFAYEFSWALGRRREERHRAWPGDVQNAPLIPALLIAGWNVSAFATWKVPKVPALKSFVAPNSPHPLTPKRRSTR